MLKNIYSKNNRTAITLLVVVIIFIQTLCAVYIASLKADLHIDETYSYILSNSHNADRLSSSDKLWDRWVSSEEWNEYTTVQQGEQFDYSTVYKNNTLDCHPPLFYWCLNTVSSFFPDTFSIWLGTSVNILFFTVSLILLYIVSKKLIKNSILAIIPLLLWGFSPIAFDTAIFIRMYSLSTMLTLLFVLINIEMQQKGQSPRLLFMGFAVTFWGAMTHYYFILSAFCICLAYCIICFVRKDFKNMLVYGICELCAIILLFAAYPAAITQITGSSTNNIGNEVAATFFTISGWPIAILKYFYHLIVGYSSGLIRIFFVTAVLTAVSIFVIVREYKKAPIAISGNYDRESNRKYGISILVYLSVILLYIIIIAKLSYKFTYARYLYHVAPLCAVVLVMICEYICRMGKLHYKTVFCIISAFAILNAGGTLLYRDNSYLLLEEREYRDSLYGQYGDIPVLLLTDKRPSVPTINYTMLKNYSDVYMTTRTEIENIDSILKQKDCSNGILLMIWTDKYWGNGYDADLILQKLNEIHLPFEDYKYIGQHNFCKIYYAH